MRGLKILAWMVVAVLSLPAVSAPTYGGDSAQYDLRIPRQSLSTALQEFAKQSGVQIIFFSKVTDGFEAPSVNGKYTAADALQRLLDHSELTFQELNPKTIQVEPKAATNDLKKTVGTSIVAAVAASDVGSSIRLAQADTPNTPAGPSSPDGAHNADRSATSLDVTEPQESRLAEIIVTAQKRAENLQKVPIAVTALSPDQLAASGVRTTQDLATAVPGLQLLSIADAITPHLRGVGSGVTAAGIDSAVAGYVDGVYYGFAPDLAFDFFDVTQVSVLKGPQGTLFGRNATGGVLQFTTRDPTADYHATVNTSLDNYLTWRTNAYVGGGLTDTLKAGLTVHDTAQGIGWGTNVNNGVDNHKIGHDILLRGKLIWGATDGTVVKLESDYTDRAGSIAPNFKNFPGYGGLFPSSPGSNPWNTDDYIDSINTTKSGGAALTLEQELSFAKFTSITAYRRASNDFIFQSSSTPVESLDLNVDEWNSQITQEFQLTSHPGAPLEWTAGAYYYWNRATQNLFVFDHGSLVAPFTQLRFPAEQITNSFSGFAQGTYHLNDLTRLTIGLRYTYEKRDFEGTINGTFPGGSVLPIYDAAPGASITAEKPTWRFALDRDLSPDVIGYVSYNRGFKSGGFNIRDPSNAPYLPEKLDAYEGGIKSTLFDKAARLNVAGFYYNYDNIQVPTFTSLGTLTVVNGAKARIYGLDVDFVQEVATGLKLMASGEWLNAKFQSFPNAVFSIPNPGNNGATLTRGEAAGNYLPYSPQFTASVGVDYEVDVPVGKFGVNVNDNYNSGFYGEADNRLHQGQYHLANASLSLKSANGRISGRLFINNILDKAVASQMSTLAVGYLVDYSNPPRIYGASVQLDF